MGRRRRAPQIAARPDDELSVIRADLNIGDAAVRWGFYPEARRRLDQAVAAGAKSGYLRMRDMAQVTSAHLDWYTGRWPGLAERAAALAAIEEEPLIALDGLLITALLTSAAATEAGELAAAGDQFEHVLTEVTRRGIVDMALEPAAALAALRLAEGRVADSLALTDEGMRVVTRKGSGCGPPRSPRSGSRPFSRPAAPTRPANSSPGTPEGCAAARRSPPRRRWRRAGRGSPRRADPPTGRPRTGRRSPPRGTGCRGPTRRCSPGSGGPSR